MPGISLLDAQQIYTNNGLRTQYGLILPAGSRVAFGTDEPNTLEVANGP